MNATSAKKIGENIRTLRESAGMSQSHLAIRMGIVGIRQTTITKIENGSRRLAFDEALAIARAFNVSLDDLCQRPLEPSVLELMAAKARLAAAEDGLRHAQRTLDIARADWADLTQRSARVWA